LSAINTYYVVIIIIIQMKCR